MPQHRKPARMLISAALAATTTLTGPTFAMAEQARVLRMAQADAPPPPDDGGVSEGAPAPAAESPAEAPPEQPREAQPDAVSGGSGEEAPTRQRREREPEGTAAEPPTAGEAEPARREQRQPRADDGNDAGTEETQRPRRERRNEAPREEPAPAERPSEASPPEAPRVEDPAGEAAGEPTRRQRPRERSGQPAEATPPAEPAEGGAPATPPPPGRAPAGTTTPATPDASAPAVTPAPAPASEVPTAPSATEQPAAPAAPAPATPPGAPDAATAPAQIAPPAPATNSAPPSPASPPTDPSGAGAAVPPPQPTATAPAPAAPPPPAPDLRPQPVPADVQNAPVDPGGVGQSDARVQTLRQPVEIQPISRERGERIREEPRYELPPEAQVVRSEGNRQILSLGAAAAAGAVAGAAAGYFIRSNDDERLGVDASENYTERLPRGRTRETIVRPNGVQVVTISNRYGDVIQRSRVMPDGREVVLFYDPYSEDAQRPDYYEDPGRDLPPIRVDIPEDEYVVDIDEPDEGVYYDTLVAPPVETVERIYSVDEVRRSTRIREKVRRIDLATVNFDFGSASIAQDQVPKLQALAEAVQRIVRDNPGESFLIEGHTDAVGSNEANLVLSDQRAEAVASALSRYFEVPAENLVTQGYGEQELKVNTQGENRENRRVTVRRITALVKPVTTSSR